MDMSNYNIYTNKDGRMRAYDKTTHKVVSYPRLLGEMIIGRPLRKDEDVHHIDGNPLNNDLSNLEVINHIEHEKKHGEQHKIKYEDKLMICPECGKEFLWTAKQQHKYKKNSNRHKNNNTTPFCSRKCIGKHNQRMQAQTTKSKYVDRIEICSGCGNSFVFTAKRQRDKKNKTSPEIYCCLECYRTTHTKYDHSENNVKQIQETIKKYNGSFTKASKELGIERRTIADILKKNNLPYHSKDYAA